MRRNKVNVIPNAQLAAWIGCMPSTIHTWRKNKKVPFTSLLRISDKTGLRIKDLLTYRRLGTTLEFIEAMYLDKGSPFSHISGRDFWDNTRTLYREVQERINNG
jgi:hypothetical protein